jgi:hypothetical protein
MSLTMPRAALTRIARRAGIALFSGSGAAGATTAGEQQRIWAQARAAWARSGQGARRCHLEAAIRERKRAAADAYVETLRESATPLVAAGRATRAIAKALNDRGLKPPRSGAW